MYGFNRDYKRRRKDNIMSLSFHSEDSSKKAGFSLGSFIGTPSVSGGGYISQNTEDDKKKIDIFNPNASTAGYNQVSAWTTT